MAIFILNGEEFEPQHAKIVLNIMAGMEQELKRLKGGTPASAEGGETK